MDQRQNKARKIMEPKKMDLKTKNIVNTAIRTVNLQATLQWKR